MSAKVWKQLSHILEFAGAILIISILKILPFKCSSVFGGVLARTIGPLLSVTNTARRNLQRVFPEKNGLEIETIIRKMWENLGRTFGEYPHLHKINVWATNSPVEIVNGHILDSLLQEQKPAIFFLGHMANWEYATMAALQKGLKIAQLYRVLNNPYVARVITQVHRGIASELVTKGAKGARQSLAVLKRGDTLSMLVDQKLNEGISVPFLGINAMTPTALAKLALKFQCALVPVRVERVEGVRCRVTYYPPLQLPREGSLEERIYQVMLNVNELLSRWIREKPRDWMWLHNRWPKI